MNYGFLDFVGNLGVLTLVVAYLLLQLNRLSNGLLYSVLNAAGAGLIVISLLGNYNLSAFIIEVFWVLISFFGIYRNLKTKPVQP